MKRPDLEGIFPPIPTPFKNNRVAHDHLKENIKKWRGTGLKGFVALGSNGEYVYLSPEEKRAVVKTVVENTPKKMSVIAGTGCESTHETIELTNDCARLGARAALVVTPHYYGGRMTDDALKKHYITIADRSDIPIILYSVPKFTHIDMSAKLISELSRHPNIVGIKDSAGNVNFLGQLLNGVAPNFAVLAGTAGILHAALTLGCSGGIVASANVAPKMCVRMMKLIADGRYDAARKLQLKLLPVNNAVTFVYGVPGLKVAMDLLGYYGGKPRPPLQPARVKEKLIIKQLLQTAGLLAG
jgi:4-hydroxy-2-oxoglutarate aldolase